VFLSAETVDLWLTLTHPRAPVSRIIGVGPSCQWALPNRAGHAQLLRASGFEVAQHSKLYAIPFGRAHPPRGHDVDTLRALALQRLMCGRVGVPHAAALARPVV
jgi:hypothetical protein